MADETDDAAPAPRPDKRVQCIVQNKPWTYSKPLDFKEIAVVDADLADLMYDKDQVVILGDA